MKIYRLFKVVIELFQSRKALTQVQAIIIALIVIIVGVGAYFLVYNHPQNKLSGQTIDVGVIAPSTDDYGSWSQLFPNIIQPDLNTKYKDINLNFQFHLVDAKESDQTHLDLVKAFHSQGIDLIIGGDWSSMAQSSLTYVNDNKMILISAGSTSSSLQIEKDRLFRFCQSDAWMVPSLVDMLQSRDIKSVVIIQRGDDWGDGIASLFGPAWTAKGGKLAGESIRYNADLSWQSSFSSYLQSAENQVTTALGSYPGKVAVLLLSFSESVGIASQAKSYTHLYNDVKWYGADGTANSNVLAVDAGSQSVQLGIYSLLPQELSSSEFMALKQRYAKLYPAPMTIFGAYCYDAAFALAGAIVSSESKDANVVAAALPNFCKTYMGVSGNCALNVYGDRQPVSYDIWGFKYSSGNSGPVIVVKVGAVDPTTDKVTWSLP